MKNRKLLIVAGLSVVVAGVLLGAGSGGQKPISLLVNGMTQDEFLLHGLPRPHIENGYVMVPAAALKRTFREDVKWYSASRSVEINPDVWKEGGFGYHAEEWPKVRNVIYKYLIAVQEQDTEAQKASVVNGFKSDDLWDGLSIMDIQFQDGKENDTTYTVRVATVNYQMTQDELFSRVMDFSIDKKSLKIIRISSAPGSVSIRDYNVLPGIEIRTSNTG